MTTTLLTTLCMTLLFCGTIAVFNGPIKDALGALEERCDKWEDPRT